MDEYQIQTKAQVQNIEQRKQTKSLIDDLLDSPINQNNTEISVQLKEIKNQINNMTDNNIDANLISDKIDNIDTNVIEAQIQDLLITVNQQNEKIDKIKKKIDTILNKI